MVAVGKNVLEKCVHMRGERNNVRMPGLFRSVLYVQFIINLNADMRREQQRIIIICYCIQLGV